MPVAETFAFQFLLFQGFIFLLVVFILVADDIFMWFLEKIFRPDDYEKKGIH
jgi:hypothetical protein